MKELILSKLFILLICQNCIGQYKQFEYKNFTQEEGLPSNETYWVYRDSKNYMWIASDKGVVRYNGSKMYHYELPDNVVFKIYEDSKGRIWFFSHTGKLAYFFNEKIYPYKYNDSIIKYTKSIVIADAYVNENDEIFFIADANYKISNSGKILKTDFYQNNYSDSVSFGITEIYKNRLFIKPLNWSLPQKFPNLILEYSNKIYYLNKIEASIVRSFAIKLKNGDILIFIGESLIKLTYNGIVQIKKIGTQILSIFEDSNGLIWVGLRQSGLLLLNEKLEEIYNDSTLKEKTITSITSDFEGGIWISTLENGVYYLKNKDISKKNLGNLLNQNIHRIFNVNDSLLLIANNKGVYEVSNEKNTFLIQQPNYSITDIFYDKFQNLHFGGSFEPNLKNRTYAQNASIPINNVFFYLTPSEITRINNNQFIVTGYNNVSQFEIDNNLLQHHSSTSINVSNTLMGHSLPSEKSIIFYDHKNQLWQGTMRGLNTINKAFNAIIPFKQNNPIIKKGVTCMRQLTNGIYVIGIRFGGIALMQDTTIIGTITEQDGLLNNAIQYLLPIKNQLWAATANGLSVIQFKSYNPIQYSITNIGKNEGLYNVIIYQVLPFQNNILVATSKGIYSIENPEEIISRKPAPIPFYITSITTYRGDTNEINSIAIPYFKRRISIKYDALCFNSPEELKYYYRFKNDDTTWRINNGTELLFENLSPGVYDLELKAENFKQQRFSEIKKLQIVVNKPWWQSNLFIICLVLLLGTIIYFYLRWRTKIIRDKGIEKTNITRKMLELEHAALRSQMNPHFIFNCLTSIQQLIISGKTTDANEYLVKFARLIRKTLDISNKTFISIEEEISYLKEYLIMEQLRLPDKFDFNFDIDESISTYQTEIPGMMLQPVIENAIRHGIKHLTNRKGKLIIKLKKEDTFIACTIIDNGIGRNNEINFNTSFQEHRSYGMEIIKKRLSSLNNNKYENFVSINDLTDDTGKPAGTEVIIQIPFKIISDD